MINGRCHCVDIKDYRSDLMKLDGARARMQSISREFQELQSGINQIKQVVQSACNAEMGCVSSYEFISQLAEIQLDGKQRAEKRSQSVELSLESLRTQDRNFHKSLLRSIEVDG